MRPSSPDVDPGDLAACRVLLRGGSRTFFAASLLLPRRVRDPASVLYAFCRLADDAIDRADRPGDALDRLHRRLDRVYDGRPAAIPVERALAAVVERHAVPRPLLDGLLEGFAWDAAGRRYEDLDDLEAYAARVAGTVGVMMAVLMGVRAPGPLARAADLGIAMQLSNIARDVGEDARMGRIYLPLGWLRAAGIDPEAWLARARFDPALAEVVGRLLRAADACYARADAGIAALPAACRPGIRAARLLYAEIGREVERPGFDPVARRATVPGRRKLRLVGRALLRGRADAERASAPAAAGARFLVDAVVAAPTGGLRLRPGGAARGLDARIGWLVDLFQRLERGERA